MSIKHFFRKRFAFYMAQHNPPTSNNILLHNRRLYILPTRFGIIYSLLLLVIFLAAINYQNSLSFALSFLLTAIGIISLWQTHKNLLNLEIQLLPIKTVFCGEQLELNFIVKHNHSFSHYSVGFQYQNESPSYLNIEPNKAGKAQLKLKTTQRGQFQLDGITIFTRFPTGLFHCWGWLRFNHPIIIYAKPINTALEPVMAHAQSQGSVQIITQDGDDFCGLREYKQGESLKHISWKALAQGRGKLSKTFESHAQPTLWIDWDKINAASIEERLSRVTSLVIKAHASNQKFGLKTPFITVSQNSGSSHKEQCLTALATYRQQQSGVFNV